MLLVVTVVPAAGIGADSKPELVILDWTDRQNTMVVNGLLEVPSAKGYVITQLLTKPVPSPTLLWRNWALASVAVPATRIDVAVYRLEYIAIQ